MSAAHGKGSSRNLVVSLNNNDTSVKLPSYIK